jgi:hypothetical protein
MSDEPEEYEEICDETETPGTGPRPRIIPTGGLGWIPYQVLLRYGLGWTVVEIAKSMGWISEQTVYKYMRRFPIHYADAKRKRKEQQRVKFLLN